MFYEERCIDGAWEHRTTPCGEWKPGRLEAEQTKVVPSLLPCPFCGCAAKLSHPPLMGGYLVHCDEPSCQAQGRLSGDLAKACAAWNRRATPAPVSGGEVGKCAHPADRMRWYDGSVTCCDCREVWHRDLPSQAGPPQVWGPPVPPSPGSEGADAMHKAASDTAPDAGHVKGTGEQAGEVVAWLHSVVHAPDAEPDQALSFAPDSFPFSDTELFRSVRAEPLVLASALAQARAECRLFADQRDREHERAKQWAREVVRLREALRNYGRIPQDEWNAARDTLLASGGEGGE